jgi:SAM-dependent methyltransferase
MQERLDALFAPVTEIAIEAAAPRSGERAIDIGCGCGATLLELARRVAPAGSVLGVDISAPMAARARERIAAGKLSNAEVLTTDAATHGFPPNHADLLFSRFGVMFFSDPTGTFAHLRQAMRQDGRLLFAVWRSLAENHWARVPIEAARPLLPAEQPADPAAPGPFALADPDRVRRILAEAGWRKVNLARHEVPIRLAGPGRIDEAAELATRVGPLARALGEADPALRTSVRDVVARTFGAHHGPEGVTLSGSMWIVSAQA